MAFSDFQLGMKASTSKTITETDVILFAGVSTDINPVHLDEETAKSRLNIQKEDLFYIEK